MPNIGVLCAQQEPPEGVLEGAALLDCDFASMEKPGYAALLGCLVSDHDTTGVADRLFFLP